MNNLLNPVSKSGAEILSIFGVLESHVKLSLQVHTAACCAAVLMALASHQYHYSPVGT